MTQTNYTRNIQSVGMTAFVNFFHLYKKYSFGLISKEQAVREQINAGLSNENGALIRLSNAKVIFDNNVEYKILKDIIESTRIDYSIKQKAINLMEKDA